MTGFRSRSSRGLSGARSTERSGVAVALIGHISRPSGSRRLSKDDLIEIEHRPLNARGDHPAGSFHYAAEARSEAAGHAALHGDFNVWFAIDAQWLDHGAKRSVHRLWTAGKDPVSPL